MTAKHFLTAVLAFLFTSARMQAQFMGQGKLLDSLISNIENYPEPDTFRLNALGAVLAQSMKNAVPQRVEKYFTETLNLAKKFRHHTQLASVYHYKGFNEVAKKDFHSGLAYLDSALSYYGNMNDPYKRDWGIATISMDKARAYSFMGDRNAQLKNLLEALTVYEKIKHRNAVFVAMSISGVYREIYNLEKGLEYATRAVKAAEIQTRDELKTLAYLNLALSFLSIEQPSRAETWLAKAKPLIAPANIHQQWTYYSYLGRTHQSQEKYDEAKNDFLKSLEYAEKAGHELFLLDILASLTFTSLRTNEWRESKKYIDRYHQIAKTIGTPLHKREAFRRLAEYHTKTSEYKKANEFSLLALQMNDSMLTEQNAEQLNQLEARYQFEKKENEIRQLQQEKQIQQLSLREKSIFNYVFIGITIALLAVAFLLFRNYRNRQKLQAQRIRELEKDKQLSVTDSILKGQEEERERLAKDLHDGLGGLLSGVKLSLANMKSNMVISGENVEVFERSLGLIDTSIKELRRVAQNMMPEVLIKSGLDIALKDYCKTINASGAIKVTYQSYGTERKLDNAGSLIIYRIIQELINNVIKHAGASEMLVQLIQRKDSVNLTVEDNGSGFDIQQLSEAGGAGWRNIKSRVNYLKGVVDLKSEPGKGTSVNIELRI